MKKTEVVMTDLTKLAIERCRKAFMSVGQLVDDDEARIAMLLSVAVDMTRGAAGMIEETKEGTTESQALASAVANLLRGLGVKISDQALSVKER